MLGLGLALGLALRVFAEAPAPATPRTPREFFNAGTRQLEDGKLKQAEALLEAALAAQRESVQPPALYNLGHVRFAQGAEELQKGPAAKPAAGRARAGAQAADAVIQSADAALASREVRQLVASYLQGRGARRELRAAAKIVRQALETHRAALQRWQRASGDFKSSLELRSSEDARQNAEIVDRNIARLVDSIRELQAAASALAEKEQELGEKMKEMRGNIPDQDMPPGAAGEEDEEEQEQPNGPEPGMEEGRRRSEGEEMTLSPEEAGWLLESYKLDSDRRLPMGEPEAGKPRSPDRPTW